MKNNLFLIALGAALVMLASCSKEKTVTVDGVEVQKSVIKAFEKQYPNATNVKWKSRPPYSVATFDLPQVKSPAVASGCNTVWYDDSANCKMEELDIKQLPEAVKLAFDKSIYSSYKIDDIDMISRDGFGVIYVIEVEGKDSKGAEVDLDLYFSAEGVFIKEMPDSKDDDDDDKYDTMISDVDLSKFHAFLKERFGESYILIEADFEENSLFEIEIVVEKIKYDVIFDKDAKFIYDVHEVHIDNVEAVIKEFINKNYPGQDVDEVDIVCSADGSKKYVFEVEVGDIEKDIVVRIDENGTVVEIK